jgi:acyl-CoA synthetase (AMP-forming)/AMP-acid ligase II
MNSHNVSMEANSVNRDVGVTNLVQELQDVCSKVPADPSCVFQQSSPFPPRILSYASLSKSLRLHQLWLQNTIGGVVDRFGGRNGWPGSPNVSPDSLNIVVAYLSTNSVDMLLSVLACTSSTLSTPLSSEIIPALLNTRWTSAEIVDALQPSGPSSGERYVTILLYDDAMERVAYQIIQDWKIRNTTVGRDHHQYVRLPIPIFAMVYLQTPHWHRNIDNLQHFSGIDTSRLTQERQQEQFSQRKILRAQKMGSKTDALILFTSGTSGGSKGVRLSHRALLVQALAKLEEPCSYCGDTALLASTVPIFHVGGLSSCLAVLLAGGRLVFPARRYDATNCRDGQNQISSLNLSYNFQVHDLRTSLQDPFLPVNTLVVVPVMLSMFFSDRKIDGSKKNMLLPFLETRLVLIGGQSASPDMLEMINETFPRAHIVQTYACTEAASSLTFLSLPEEIPTSTAACSWNASPRTTTVGRPIGDCVGHPPTHVKLRLYPQTKSITELSSPLSNLRSISVQPIQQPYQVGVIATSGSHVMNGYWQRGKRQIQHGPPSSSSISNNNSNRNEEEGSDSKWYVSTDLGFWDENGRLYFSGRVKDVIRTGGETVMAQEVERTLLLHPIVSECAVFARQDERFGEAVACAIVLVVGMEVTTLGLEGVKEWCQTHGLARYKCPKYLYTVDSLPRNSSGKILKHELVAQFGGRSGNLHSRL